LLSAQQVVKRVDMLRARGAARNKAVDAVKAVREGRWDKVAPGLFPPEWGGPLVSNMIDVAARDFADNLGPLPTFQCKSASMISDAAKKFADKRTKIARYYVDCSNLQDQQYDAANRYTSYASTVYLVEPDFKEKMPKIKVANNHRCYYELDHWGRYTKQLAWIQTYSCMELCAEFPDAEFRLKALLPHGKNGMQASDVDVNVIHWMDDDQQMMIVEENALVLLRVENILDRCPARVVEQHKLGDEPRGFFDDVIPVQLARGLMNIYMMEATERSVYAPMAVPDDVQEINYGPDAQLRSATPEKVQKVPLPIPPQLFGNMQMLEREQRIGSRYPEGRTGNFDASIITGQGVEALMGAFNEGIKTGQSMFSQGLQDVIAMCFEMDEKLWPDVEKTVTGDDFGSPYQITYKPSKDIQGDYSCKVTYGLTAGLDPNRALIFILQAGQAGYVSRRTAMEQLPVDINITEEEKQIDVETMRTGLTQAMAGLAQAIPMMASQGQDPTQIVYQMAESIRLRQKGEAVEEALSKIFAPPEPEPSPTSEGGIPPETGQPAPGAPPGAGGMAPGQPGEQELLNMLAGISGGGQPSLSANVQRRIPA
jgi:hypothetical protein